MNAIDRLFSEKLEGHKTTPSPDAWHRVESGLATKSTSFTWMRWAAVLIPASVAAAIWFGQPARTEIAQQPVQTAPAVQKNPELPTVVDEHNKQQPVARKTVKRKKVVSEPIAVATPEPEVETVAVSHTPEAIPLEEITIEPAILAFEPVAGEPEAKPMVIVYTLDPVVTETADKPLSLKRVVDFARSVKHSDPIGDLRGLKDELLAFDLRKKSTKKN